MTNLQSRMPRTLLCATLLAALGLAGCESMDPRQMTTAQRNTAIGAGVGAVAGAAVGNTRGAVIGAGVGALGGYVWSRHMEQKKQDMERATAGTGVAVTQTADNQLKLEIPSDISFDVGRSDIKPNFRAVLDQFAAGLSNQPNTDVRIVGHTDNTGPDELNDRLSVQRAQSTRDYLTARGVRGQQVSVSGRGKREPIADNSSESGRARNRRVDIYLGERSNVATNR